MARQFPHLIEEPADLDVRLLSGGHGPLEHVEATGLNGDAEGLAVLAVGETMVERPVKHEGGEGVEDDEKF